MMTAYASTATAIEAMKRGAHDYLPKPFELDALEVITQKALSHSALLQENERLKAQLKEHPRHSAFEGVIGQSAPMRALLSLVERVAPTPTPVLLLGESGTGKEVIAQAIHKLSPRASKPFVVVNCAALPDHLFESELFGHTRGAFTGALEDKKGLFQAAEGGTLLLDEIGELPLAMQAKVLRAIQARRVKAVGATTEEEVDIRLLAATNRSLSDEVKAGTFREDLYYRLNVIPLTLPPLRERPADIPLLIEYFLQTLSAQRSIPTPSVERGVISALLNAPLPGNVRELKNLVERALTLSPGGVLTLNDFMLNDAPGHELTELNEPISKLTLNNLELKKGDKSEQVESCLSTHTSEALMSLLVHRFEEERSAEGVSPVWSLDEHLEALEGALIVAALERTQGNRTEAAKLLNVSFRSLRYRLKKYPRL
jgi:DNA-binding NtrC family response regulator